MARLFDTGIFSVNATNGSIGVGYKLYFYTTGTSTPKNTYPTRADAEAGTNANANPVVAASDGRFAPIWLASGDYKVVLKDFDDTTLETKDPAEDNFEGQLASTASGKGASRVGNEHGGTVQDFIDDLTGTGAAANIGALAGDGVTSTNLQQHIVRTYLEDVGVTSAGTAAANAAALTAAIAGGDVTLHARPGTTYNMAGVVLTDDNIRIVCEGGHKPTFYMPAATFTNTTLKSFGTTANLFYAHGELSGAYTPLSGLLLENFIIESEVSDARYLRGISIRNATNFSVNGVEIFNFPTGIGITLSSVLGGLIDSAYIHDFNTNYAWGSGTAQMTGIEIDQDRINSVGSESVRIKSPRIDDLVFGATTIAAIGDQVDGINICHHQSLYHSITDPCISNVNEAIDIFGSYGTFTGGNFNTLRGCGYKIIHGASYNSIYSPTMKDVTLSFICFAGSNSAGVGDTKGNVVYGGSCSGLNYGNNAASTCAGVFVTDNGGTAGRPKYNSIHGMVIDMGAYGPYGWADDSTANDNLGEAIQFITGAALIKRVNVTAAAGKVSLAGASGTYYTSLT